MADTGTQLEKAEGQNTRTLAPAAATRKLLDVLESRKESFARALSSYGVDPDLFIQVVATKFLAEPKLRECTLLSIYQAAIESAQAGLLSNGEEATIVPYRDKKAGTVEAQFQPMYQGFVRLILRSGAKKVEARVVHDGDVFDYAYGLNPRLEHVPRAEAAGNETTHAYAIVWLANGETQFEVMDRAELDKIRQRAAEYSEAWTQWPDEMRRKSVVRRLRKYVELSPQASAVFRKDDLLDIGSPKPLGEIDPRFQTRTIEERAADNARRAGDFVRSAVEDARGRFGEEETPEEEGPPARDESGDPLDRTVKFGKFKGKTWREVLESKTGRDYLVHWILTPKCSHPSIDETLRPALTDAVEVALGGTPEPKEDEKEAESEESAEEIAERKLAEAWQLVTGYANSLASMGAGITTEERNELERLREAKDTLAIVDAATALRERLARHSEIGP